jgi:hypothetical protein
MAFPGFPMQLQVPSDARFRPLILAVARRVAQSVGLSAAEAGTMGDEVADRAAAAREQSGAGVGMPLDLTFELAGRGATVLRIHGRCGTATIEVTRQLTGA